MNAFAPRRVVILAGQSAEAQKARAALVARYGSAGEDEADMVVALGGDGFMLETLHRFLRRGLPVYGMNRGSVGFLMNDYREDDLPARLAAAQTATVHPLRMLASHEHGAPVEALAINEVSLLRESRQAAKIRILVDGKARLPELI